MDVIRNGVCSSTATGIITAPILKMFNHGDCKSNLEQHCLSRSPPPHNLVAGFATHSPLDRSMSRSSIGAEVLSQRPTPEDPQSQGRLKRLFTSCFLFYCHDTVTNPCQPVVFWREKATDTCVSNHVSKTAATDNICACEAVERWCLPG